MEQTDEQSLQIFFRNAGHGEKVCKNKVKKKKPETAVLRLQGGMEMEKNASTREEVHAEDAVGKGGKRKAFEARRRGREFVAHRDEKGSLGLSYRTTIPVSILCAILSGTVVADPKRPRNRRRRSPGRVEPSSFEWDSSQTFHSALH